ncbi:hypothetical protein HNR05_000805 [Leifsonia psychrotolerans]|uniref:Uncharacterized protein n=1 Tax=Glaciibacter psychrotolerans TaxID=670054 RepID=A0A7Z0ECD2_9MICO|nr:hypothetical protein [Leifsonia psychrotolerans]
MIIRRYSPTDAHATLDDFTRAVHDVAINDYT